MKRFLLILTMLLVAGPALAADPEWTVDFGAVTRARPTHLGSDHYAFDLLPLIEATYGDTVKLSLDDGAKWIAAQVGPVQLGPVVEYRQSFNDRLPAGAFRTSDAIEVGGFASARTPIGIAEARLRRAVNGYGGWSGEVSFVTGGPVTPKTMLGGQLRLAWADSNFTQEYFGLKPRAAAHVGLPKFFDENYITVGGDFGIAHDIGRKTRIVAEISADRIVGELRPSPLFSSRNIFTAAVGFTYHWSSATRGRSL